VEFPLTIEVDPTFAVKIGTRMFGTRNIHHNHFLAL
jgi:hypothetical protein